MHVVLTISVATILTAAVVLWIIFALARSYFRRQSRIKQELKELKRQQKALDRKTITGIAKRL